MKIRILLSVLFIALWSYLNGLFTATDVVVKNNLTVNTVNGGDAAFIAQQTYFSGNVGALDIFTFTVIMISIWYAPLRAALSNKN